MKQYLTLILFLPAIISFGQDTTYYDIDGEDVSIIDSAYYYKIVQNDQTDSILATVKTFYKSGQLKTEAKYSDYKREIIDGVFKSYYENGKSKI
jgi:antitoxin component YwqK of YwqJK toxin-antitoxin module